MRGLVSRYCQRYRVHGDLRKIIAPASAIEAGTAETTKIGSVHESAAPQEDAHD